MARDLPYLPTYKNLGKLFEKIASAKTPDAFTHDFLANTIGLKGTGDRAFISLLKKLGFLDQNGKPTQNYALLKNNARAQEAIAEGIRSAYLLLFESDENANKLEGEGLQSLIAQVTGVDKTLAKSIAYTFSALVKLGNFSKLKTIEDEAPLKQEEASVHKMVEPQNIKNLRHDFHFNIQIHLPSNGTEDTYLNIFNALRKVFN